METSSKCTVQARQCPRQSTSTSRSHKGTSQNATIGWLSVTPRMLSTHGATHYERLGHLDIVLHDVDRATHVGDNKIGIRPQQISRVRPPCRSRHETSKCRDVDPSRRFRRARPSRQFAPVASELDPTLAVFLRAVAW